MYLFNMNFLIYTSLALIGGMCLALQGGFNTQLGVLLKSPVLASLIAFSFSTMFALLLSLRNMGNFVERIKVAEIPYYLWFIGGLLSAIGISLYYYTIPKLGMSTMISLGLFGQLLISSIAGHYGWFNLSIEPLNVFRILGVLAMSVGIFLMNWK